MIKVQRSVGWLTLCDDAVVELVIAIVSMSVLEQFLKTFIQKKLFIVPKTMNFFFFLPHPFNFRIVVYVRYLCTYTPVCVCGFKLLGVFEGANVCCVIVNDFKYVIVSHVEKNSWYIFSYLYTLFRNGYKCQDLSKVFCFCFFLVILILQSFLKNGLFFKLIDAFVNFKIGGTFFTTSCWCIR